MGRLFRELTAVLMLRLLEEGVLTEKQRDAPDCREGNENITQISIDLGFNSVHYFSRLFKKYENLSPSEYIASIKSKLGI